jgi:penicillin amidase
VEILRDEWGIPHVFAEREDDGFFGLGFATAEDRILQMELFRRRTTGRLAEVLGNALVSSDLKFRIAGVGAYCQAAAAALPADERSWLHAYARGVNAFLVSYPETVRTRLAPLGITPAPWTEADSICAWLAVAEAFDPLYDESAIASYHEFAALAAQIGEAAALVVPGSMLDDVAAVVPEHEMAKNAAAYARLKARQPIPGSWRRSMPDEVLRFSHAWAVDGSRTVSGAPLLESDPQSSVNNPPLWYEFHLAAGRFNVRGIGFAGAPAMLIGFNRSLAWGASALGAGSTVTFLDRLSSDGRGYVYRGDVRPLERWTETIDVKAGRPVTQDVVRTQHGFVFNALATDVRPGELYVSHRLEMEQRRTSVTALLGMMAATNWAEFREASAGYFSPGLHIVYADARGTLAYETLLHAPLTRRTPRMALEGWTGDDEILGRIALDDMPRMVNPDSHVISHANNLPIGSWYPYDLGIGTGGVGHTSRSLRLLDLLAGSRRFSVDTFESQVHRDDVQSVVAILFPIARRVAIEDGVSDAPVTRLLAALQTWDLRYRADQPEYRAAMTLGGSLVPAYRRSPLNARLGGGEGGVSHLARLLRAQYAGGVDTPDDRDVRDYLAAWLRVAAAALPEPTPGRPFVELHQMPYQENAPLRFPSLDSWLDLTSPPLACGQGGTIWSQRGNSYTQIVDLADTDRSRAVLPPGISEDPSSRFHTDQMDLWVRGTTRPAPLSRTAVESITTSRIRLKTKYVP